MRDEVVAPLTEEFVFRACCARLWDGASFPAPLIIAGLPLCFGLAHAHHFAEHMRRLENKRLAAAQVAFQLLYTSIFGAYATFLLLRTGSAIAVFLVHAFCNHMGVPDLGFLQEQHVLAHRRNAILAVYVVGMVAFGYLLSPLTAGRPTTFRCMAASAH
mmetsp:Transcript_28111/g.78778  ORF Transcript_28111/g.78778 Transcript_28111/m.78778 type:complete len:159 (-) Transcript_28111:33-509(-)